MSPPHCTISDILPTPKSTELSKLANCNNYSTFAAELDTRTRTHAHVFEWLSCFFLTRL
jgi:hypothetical protein